MRYLENYLERIKRKGNLTLADAISKTVSDVVPQYISNFSFREHVVSLLVGDVQSGKQVICLDLCAQRLMRDL